MALTPEQQLVAVKAYARGNAIPLDATSKFDSLEDATTYAQSNPVAYAGQQISVLSGGEYKLYMLQVDGIEGTFKLSEVTGGGSTPAKIVWGTF